MHVLWVNEAADFVGGCEQYIFNTVRLLRERGVRSTLLYDCCKPFSAGFVEAFDHAFPMLDIPLQLREANPDLIYIHRLAGRKAILPFIGTGYPALRFFHDYQIFCPREHRYRTIGLKTCQKPIGLRCYPCLGVINRSDTKLGFRFNFVGSLRAAIRENQRLDGYVTGSHYMADLIAAHGFDARRTHVVPLYALPPRAIPEMPREPDLFFFAGQLIRSKGLDTLLHAMAASKRPSRLFIAGQGRQEAMFRALSHDLGLEDRVTFLGQIPHEDLAVWYSRAACVVVPSRYPETFGLIGPEAMRYGAAMIGTAVGAIGEWLEDGVTGLSVKSNDSIGMAQALDYIVENPEKAIEMGRAGKKRYQEQFLPEKHVELLMKLFQTMVKEQ